MKHPVLIETETITIILNTVKVTMLIHVFYRRAR